MKQMKILVAILCFLSSCNKSYDETKIKEIMGNWYGKEIILPTNLELLNPDKTGAIENIYNLNSSEFYIIHYFQADCDKCIDELRSAKKFIEEHNTNKVTYIFIADGPSKIFAQTAINELEFVYPVYFESKYAEFKKLNGVPLNDKLYDTMLIKDKKLILFGSIFLNNKAEAIFNDITSR